MRSTSPLPAVGGIGLKPAHIADILDGTAPAPGFFEVHAENFMVAGGWFHHGLRQLRERCAMSLHGVGLSLGGEAPPDAAHLDRLADLLGRYQPAAFSEHLAWSAHGGIFFNDLLPLAYDRRSLARVCEHVDRVQARLGRRMLLENPATYLAFEASALGEAQFLSEVVARTGCGLLLDVSNAYVCGVNHGSDPMALIDGLPLHAVGEIHLAGFAVDGDGDAAPLLIDDHGSAVHEAVWDLYRRVIDRLGPTPTLVEWDNDVPPLASLLAQAGRADAVMATRAEKQPLHRLRGVPA